MKVRVKRWKEIKKTLNLKNIENNCYSRIDSGTPKFNTDMIPLCGSTVEVFNVDSLGRFVGHWDWHRDWLEIIDENEEIAEIYALLLIESGEM